MKSIIVLFLFISALGFSQGTGKIFFRNGNTFEGKILIKSPLSTGQGITKIHYFPNENTQITKGFIDIDRVEMYPSETNKNEVITFYFKKFKNKELFLKKLESYKDFDVFIGRVYEFNSLDLGVNGATSESTNMIEEFYLGKKYGMRLEKLHKRPSSKKFKTLLLQYASKCEGIDEIVQKYQKNKKLEKRELFKELKVACN